MNFEISRMAASLLHWISAGKGPAATEQVLRSEEWNGMKRYVYSQDTATMCKSRREDKGVPSVRGGANTIPIARAIDDLKRSRKYNLWCILAVNIKQQGSENIPKEKRKLLTLAC